MCPGRRELTKGGSDFPLDRTELMLFRSGERHDRTVRAQNQTNLPPCRTQKTLDLSAGRLDRTKKRKLRTNQRKEVTNQRKYRTEVTKYLTNQQKEGPDE
jgi:hypothetical protein